MFSTQCADRTTRCPKWSIVDRVHTETEVIRLTSTTEIRSSAPTGTASGLLPEIGRTAKIGLPLALGELGWMSTYIVDALMIGRLPHSALSISASSLGNTIFYAIAFCLVGFFTGLETVVAQAYGRGDRPACARTLAQSLWFVLLGTPIVMGLTLAAIPLLPLLGTPPDIVAETSRYLHPLVWSTAPLLLFLALRRYLQSMDRVTLATVTLITASLVNWGGDWAFLYGHLGLPAMGIAGSAWATVLVRFYTVVLLGIGCWASLLGRKGVLTREMFHPRFTQIKLLLLLGWPAALQSITEFGVSTYMSILCARLGVTLLAAHQVVLDLDAFVYMIPSGLAFATVIRVGQAAGRGSLPQIRRSANASLVLALGMISVAATLFAGLPHFWASHYTNDPAVVAAAAPIFLICGVLQMGDAASAVLAYALYGLGDTWTPFAVYTFWYWGIGMPLAYWLCFSQGLSLKGLWLGRAVAALGSAATFFVIWRMRLADLENPKPTRTFTLSTPIAAQF